MTTQLDSEAVDGGREVQGAQTLLRGLDILLFIGMSPQPLRFRDLETAINIPRATLHRLVAALTSRGLLRYDERAKTYSVGMRVLELSRRTLDTSGIIRTTKPEIGRLARHLKRTILVQVLDGADVFVLDFEDYDLSFARLVRAWPRSNAIETAAGRAMLAAIPRDKCEQLLRRAEDSPDMERIWGDLSIAKALGYSVMAHEPGSGKASAAAAIVDTTGYPIAALSCQLDANASSEELHEIGRTIAEGARRASGQVRIGFATPTILPRPETPAAPAYDLEVLPTGRDFVGDNPIWHARSGRLYWVDVLAPALRWWEPATRAVGRVELSHITAGLAFDTDDRLIALGERGVCVLDPEEGRLSTILDPEADRKDNRFNIASVDPMGRIWAGTMAVNHEVGKGSLWSIEAGLVAKRRLDRVGMPKNVAFDAASRHMYFADTAERTVFVYEFDLARGELGARRPFVVGDASSQPGGIAIDAEDHVWVTFLGGWCVRRFAPDGTMVAEIVLPIPMPMNCAFGGPDLKTLFVTSTWIRMPHGLSAQAPSAGQLIAVHGDVAGRPTPAVRF
ncbi:SMP-30/gluconolactonase/LRE family protein [Acuticoccus kandeliae]|uniref:SMP-30/gluconolactonase/LRE family protein n=1 Tax=Acuticoccus kandeliae TaxID=2073160 RepID=UPI000D3E944D|nr:SMP-30/gluconolactonase/LRE family protein [Acuticoccus kandeliae]